MTVTSLAEVWIEIYRDVKEWFVEIVTSLAEVWIEIEWIVPVLMMWQSLPLRKCGLKSEIPLSKWKVRNSHFPCGSVD